MQGLHLVMYVCVCTVCSLWHVGLYIWTLLRTSKDRWGFFIEWWTDFQAGIASPNHPDQLLIALEPEAASIYVRRLKVYQLLSSDSSSPVGGGGDGGSVHLSPSKFGDTSPFSLSPNPSSLATDSPRFDDLQISPGRLSWLCLFPRVNRILLINDHFFLTVDRVS